MNTSAPIVRQIIRVALALLLTVTAALAVISTGDVYSFVASDPPVVRIHGFTMTYYRPPEHVFPPDNLLDPYDSFQKDKRGDLIISASGTNMFSNFAQTTYQGYILKTRKGSPITVYQETPSRRLRHKSNCHGLTFLGGDYWLLGSQVERILDDNNWVIVTESHATAGDIAVYREPNGRITHTARITGRDNQGRILVDSKNGFEKKFESIPATSVVPN